MRFVRRRKKKRTDLKGEKNEEPDEENAVGGIGAGNRPWDNNNGNGLQEERYSPHSKERDPQKTR
jgi:hypothetical protein